MDDYVKDELETYSLDDCSPQELQELINCGKADERLKKEAIARLGELGESPYITECSYKDINAPELKKKKERSLKKKTEETKRKKNKSNGLKLSLW